jgi:ABC-type nitrate/sulfonate/bicarbonate transport system substrate-binding protein
MQMIMSGLRYIVDRLGVALVFTICSSTAALSATTPVNTIFAYGAINAYMTSTWVAREQGLFAKHNVEIEPVFIIASRAAQAMLAGEVHVGLIGPTHVANAVAAGGDLVMFMGNQNSVRYQLVVHPSIKRAEDLKGKRVAIGASAGGLASLGAHVALEHLGLNPKRDNITLLLTGEEPVRVAALQSGNAQATLLAPEMTKQISGQGFAVLVDMGQLNIPFQASGMVTTRKILRSDPLMLERVGRATVDAVSFIRNPINKKSVLQTMIKQLRIATAERAEPFYAQLVEELPRSICPTTAGVRSILKLMVDLGINPKAAALKTDDVIDLGLCRRLGGDGR